MSTRDLGDTVEEYVNEVLNLVAVPNSGGMNASGSSLGFDHLHERFVGESKYKGKEKKPTITKADFEKLLKKAEQEGYKDWFYVCSFDGGKKKAIMLDLDVFAELTYNYWHPDES